MNPAQKNGECVVRKPVRRIAAFACEVRGKAACMSTYERPPESTPASSHEMNRVQVIAA